MKQCTVKDCDKKPIGKGLCRYHYDRLRRTGSTDPPPPKVPFVCKHPGCERTDGNAGHGYCRLHYMRWQTGVDMDKPVKERCRPGEPPKICASLNCTRPALYRGYCGGHVQRITLGLKTHIDEPLKKMDGKQGCKIPDCDGKHYYRGYCRKHVYTEIVKPERQKKKENDRTTVA